MKNDTKKIRLVATIIGILALFAVVIFFWMYVKGTLPAKSGLGQAFSKPIAKVNEQTIYEQELIERVSAAKLLQKEGIFSEEQAKEKVFNQLLDEHEDAIIAGRNGISVSDGDVDEAYNSLQSSSDQAFPTFLKTLGLSEKQFKTDILKPKLLTVKLTVWFYSQRELNRTAYSKMDIIEQKLSAGQSFGDLAKSRSEDKGSNYFAGDAGMLDGNNLLPELKNNIESMKSGDQKLLVSRYGIHLIKLENIGKDTNGRMRISLRQIFVEGTNFENWINQERQGIVVEKF